MTLESSDRLAGAVAHGHLELVEDLVRRDTLHTVATNSSLEGAQ